MTRQKIRRLELTAGAAPRKGQRGVAGGMRNKAIRTSERELAHKAEAAYRRTVSDWQASKPAKRKKGRERDTGAHIEKALEGQSSAADHEPLTSALRFVSRSRPDHLPTGETAKQDRT